MSCIRTKLAAALIAPVLVVAGCGGADDNDASTTLAVSRTLTKAQYVAAANEVCKATTDKIVAAAADLRASGDKTGTLAVPKVADFLRKTSFPAYEGMLKDIGELKPPKKDERAIDGYIAALASAIDTAKADPTAYARTGAPDPFDDANKRANDYGMKACGS